MAGTLGRLRSSRVPAGNALLMFINFGLAVKFTHFAMQLCNGHRLLIPSTFKVHTAYIRSAVFVPRRIFAFSTARTSVTPCTAQCVNAKIVREGFRFRSVQSNHTEAVLLDTYFLPSFF